MRIHKLSLSEREEFEDKLGLRLGGYRTIDWVSFLFSLGNQVINSV